MREKVVSACGPPCGVVPRAVVSRPDPESGSRCLRATPWFLRAARRGAEPSATSAIVGVAPWHGRLAPRASAISHSAWPTRDLCVLDGPPCCVYSCTSHEASGPPGRRGDGRYAGSHKPVSLVGAVYSDSARSILDHKYPLSCVRHRIAHPHCSHNWHNTGYIHFCGPRTRGDPLSAQCRGIALLLSMTNTRTPHASLLTPVSHSQLVVRVGNSVVLLSTDARSEMQGALSHSVTCQLLSSAAGHTRPTTSRP
jgi:hypothetical protein